MKAYLVRKYKRPMEVGDAPEPAVGDHDVLVDVHAAGPPDPEFAREQGLGLPLQLVMALLSFKTRRAARRRGVRYSFLFMRASGAQLGGITKLIDAGALLPIIDRSYPFDEAAQALAHVEGGRTKGKVVITMV